MQHSSIIIQYEQITQKTIITKAVTKSSNIYTICIVCVLLYSLSSCGYQIRGYPGVSVYVIPLHIWRNLLLYKDKWPLLISGVVCSWYPQVFRHSRNFFKLKCKLAERCILMSFEHYNIYIINFEWKGRTSWKN